MTPEYSRWKNMKTRCMNPNNSAFMDYGGRGIKVCDRWLAFENFLEDMGRAPSRAHSLDRVDNNGNYCKENCRWVTRSEQARNKRNNIPVTINGVTKVLADWLLDYRVGREVFNRRVKRGMSPLQALEGKM
jgi:hypothetical protein